MSQATVPVTALHRRDFLKLSMGSAALLSVGALTAGLSGCAKHESPAEGFAYLRPDDVALFAGLIPVMLGKLLPQERRDHHIQTLLPGIDVTGNGLQAPGQKALRQLFDLLNTGLMRRLTTGVSKPWQQAEAAEISAFFDRWSSSRIGLFNGGYRALNKLIVGGWVATPEGYRAVGYPGPWQPMYEAINTPTPTAA